LIPHPAIALRQAIAKERRRDPRFTAILPRRRAEAWWNGEDVSMITSSAQACVDASFQWGFPEWGTENTSAERRERMKEYWRQKKGLALTADRKAHLAKIAR
jgi:hypothetical protein